MEKWRYKRNKWLVMAGYADLDGNGSYAAYLCSKHWRRVRKRYFATHPKRCDVCTKANIKIVLHHRHYNHMGYESDDDLVPLCDRCHRLTHDYKTTGKSFYGAVRALKWTYRRGGGEAELQRLDDARIARRMEGYPKKRRRPPARVRVTFAGNMTSEEKAKYALAKPERVSPLTTWNQSVERPPEFFSRS